MKPGLSPNPQELRELSVLYTANVFSVFPNYLKVFEISRNPHFRNQENRLILINGYYYYFCYYYCYYYYYKVHKLISILNGPIVRQRLGITNLSKKSPTVDHIFHIFVFINYEILASCACES